MYSTASWPSNSRGRGLAKTSTAPTIDDSPLAAFSSMVMGQLQCAAIPFVNPTQSLGRKLGCTR